jgi:hypothetical protein
MIKKNRTLNQIKESFVQKNEKKILEEWMDEILYLGINLN